jgi:hypothetical protein
MLARLGAIGWSLPSPLSPSSTTHSGRTRRIGANPSQPDEVVLRRRTSDLLPENRVMREESSPRKEDLR